MCKCKQNSKPDLEHKAQNQHSNSHTIEAEAAGCELTLCSTASASCVTALAAVTAASSAGSDMAASAAEAAAGASADVLAAGAAPSVLSAAAASLSSDLGLFTPDATGSCLHQMPPSMSTS